MKMAIGAVLSSVVSSTCCLGPAVFGAFGASSLVAAARDFHSFRPLFFGVSVVMLGAAFFTTYRPGSGGGAVAESCSIAGRRRTKILLLVTTVLAVLFATFPYYGV